ncbi:MAG: MarR family winged helix-turn-helix transcriptional regulator [Pseudomonadota bacterium]
MSDSQATVSKEALLSDGDDLAFRQLVHDLLAFSARLQEIRNRFGAYIGLTGIQYTLLIAISHLGKEGEVGVKKLADHLSLSGAFVTIETTKLVKLGLVEKRTNRKDRRRVLLSLGARGRALLNQLAPLQREVNDALFDSLDQRGFSILSSMAAQLKQDAENAILLADYLTENAGDE